MTMIKVRDLVEELSGANPDAYVVLQVGGDGAVHEDYVSHSFADGRYILRKGSMVAVPVIVITGERP